MCVQPVSSHMILSIHTRFELIYVLPLNAVRCYTILFFLFFCTDNRSHLHMSTIWGPFFSEGLTGCESETGSQASRVTQSKVQDERLNVYGDGITGAFGVSETSTASKTTCP